MQTPFEFGADTGRMVYVKPVDVAALPAEVQAQVKGLDQLFAVHDADGQQLALFSDEKAAYHLARENNYAPQPVH